MTVLHVISDTDRRGAQVFACDLNDELAARGRSCMVVALVRGDDEKGLAVPVLGSKPFASSTLRSLRHLIGNASVVVGHGSTTLPAIALAKQGTGTPLIYRCIGDPLYWSPTRARQIRTRLLYKATSAVVALWQGAAESLVRRFGVGRSKLRVIPNGAPAHRFPRVDASMRRAARARFGLPHDARVAVYAGALAPEKDIASAIRAVGAVAGTYLLLVGSGPERARLERLAQQEVAPGHVRLIGAVDQPAEAFAAADVLVLPSMSEGMPGVLIEAGLSGLPVVSTMVGGAGEIVSDGDTGFLVPPGDTDSLARALDRALSGSNGMGERARARCLARFEIGPVAAAWDDLLGEVGAVQ